MNGRAPRAHPSHRAGRVRAGTHTKTRGNLPRRSRSAPLPSPSGRSCPQGRRPRSGAADHPAWVYKPAATVVPDTLPDGPGHAGPRDCAQGDFCNTICQTRTLSLDRRECLLANDPPPLWHATVDEDRNYCFAEALRWRSQPRAPITKTATASDFALTPRGRLSS